MDIRPFSPKWAWEPFVAASQHSAKDVEAFAEEQGIAPDIVVGMLQRKGFLPAKRLNSLTVQLRWRS